MRVITIYLVVFIVSFAVQNVSAQENKDYQQKVEQLKKRKERISEQEKEALKLKSRK